MTLNQTNENRMGGDTISDTSDFDDFLSESDFIKAEMEADPMRSSSTLLDQQVVEFVELGDSDEYRKAVQLVRQYHTKRNYIKQILQCRNKTKHVVRQDNTVYSVEFSVSNQLRVAVSKMPPQMKLSYTQPNKVWRVKHATKFEL